MSKTSKIVIISTCVLFVLATIGIIVFENKAMTYSSAKKECVKVLEKSQTEMDTIAISALSSPLTASNYTNGKYRSYSYLHYEDTDYVKFEIDSQGMLGGQYWELIYTQSGKLYGENENYYDKEKDGNNIVKAEKLNDNWWFCWTDYDGTKLSDK